MKRRNPEKSPPRRVFLVDDHPILRQGLAQLINQHDDLCVCGEAEDVQAACAGIEEQQPDIAVVDVSLKNSNGLDLIKLAKQRWPSLPTLVLSMHDESVYAERSIRAGARGYIMKEEAPEKLVDALRAALAGEIYVSGEIAKKILQKTATGRTLENRSALEILSDRELEVFEFIGRGFGTRQIAEELHVSVKTVETHKKRIKAKLMIDDSAQLAFEAIQWVQRAAQ